MPAFRVTFMASSLYHLAEALAYKSDFDDDGSCIGVTHCRWATEPDTYVSLDEINCIHAGQIIQIIDEESGEVHSSLHISAVSAPPYNQVETLLDAQGLLSSVRALMYLSYKLRRGSARDRDTLVEFIKSSSADGFALESAALKSIKFEYSDSASQYQKNLAQIPQGVMNQAQEHAMRIARGSARKPVPDLILSMVRRDFSIKD